VLYRAEPHEDTHRQPIRVVADDRVLMRDLLRFALDELGFVMASEVSTGAAAIDAPPSTVPRS
jgi:hypothetical protein